MTSYPSPNSGGNRATAAPIKAPAKVMRVRGLVNRPMVC